MTTQESNKYLDLSKLSNQQIRDAYTFIKENLGGRFSYITENNMQTGTFYCKCLVYETNLTTDKFPRWTAYGNWYAEEENTVELTLEEFLKTTKEEWKIEN